MCAHLHLFLKPVLELQVSAIIRSSYTAFSTAPWFSAILANDIGEGGNFDDDSERTCFFFRFWGGLTVETVESITLRLAFVAVSSVWFCSSRG
ncbi:hypothetical protein PsorP6_000418 [Peronosclerospora sorghi]|uniref:Uncharacterized protein n=1 Tax=Peronosclerospora sorghi TaxID=230839 RepID=A0ACC0WT93_9STRA|nr:hypothetical protein PsorP6_000418 [Peronosclerospora sorghi]